MGRTKTVISSLDTLENEDVLENENKDTNNEVDLLTEGLLSDTIDEENETVEIQTPRVMSLRNGGNRIMANELATYRASTTGSESLKFFVEVPTSTAAWSTKAYHMALLLAESNQIDAGVEEEDIPDVTTKVAGHVITGYKKNFTHSGVYLTEDPVCNFERYLFENDETDDKTVVNLLQVDEFDEVSTGTYTAYKYTATCVPQNFGGEAQGKLNIEAKYNITSEAIKGTATYDAESGVATFTPAQ
jgi:hypothetical protein